MFVYTCTQCAPFLYTQGVTGRRSHITPMGRRCLTCWRCTAAASIPTGDHTWSLYHRIYVYNLYFLYTTSILRVCYVLEMHRCGLDTYRWIILQMQELHTVCCCLWLTTVLVVYTTTTRSIKLWTQIRPYCSSAHWENEKKRDKRRRLMCWRCTDVASIPTGDHTWFLSYRTVALSTYSMVLRCLHSSYNNTECNRAHMTWLALVLVHMYINTDFAASIPAGAILIYFVYTRACLRSVILQWTLFKLVLCKRLQHRFCLMHWRCTAAA
jgi:hypothetical protein